MAEPMTPEILRTLLTDLTLSNHARVAILAAADAWEAQDIAWKRIVLDLRKQVEALERAVDFYADLAPAPGGDRP